MKRRIKKRNNSNNIQRNIQRENKIHAGDSFLCGCILDQKKSRTIDQARKEANEMISITSEQKFYDGKKEFVREKYQESEHFWAFFATKELNKEIIYDLESENTEKFYHINTIIVPKSGSDLILYFCDPENPYKENGVSLIDWIENNREYDKYR